MLLAVLQRIEEDEITEIQDNQGRTTGAGPTSSACNHRKFFYAIITVEGFEGHEEQVIQIFSGWEGGGLNLPPSNVCDIVPSPAPQSPTGSTLAK